MKDTEEVAPPGEIYISDASYCPSILGGGFSTMQVKTVNSRLTKKFVYVVAGAADYENEDEESIIDILARLRAEAHLTESNWNLYGYQLSPSISYYEKHLVENELDVIIVPQNNPQLRYPTDEDEWKAISKSKKSAEEVFPDNPSNVSIQDNNDYTWYLDPSELKRKHWIKEVPRFFQICHNKTAIYYGLVLKNLTLYKYGDLWFDGSCCRYYTTHTNFERKIAHSLQIYEMLDTQHSEPEYIPVIATAKLIHPYSVRLIHPKDR